MKAVYVNGRIVPARAAAIPALDAGFLFGLGAFETLRFYHGEPFLLEAHLRRLKSTARYLRLPFPIDAKKFRSPMRALAMANALPGGALRIMITAGDRALGVAPSVVATVRPFRQPRAAGGVRVALAKARRDPSLPLAGIKSLHYLDHRLERERAERSGAFEALYLSPRGDVLEGTSTNVFAVFGSRIVTPPVRAGILPGITRAFVARLLGAREERIPIEKFLRADEAFLTNALIEAVPVRSLDGRGIGPGRFPVTRMLLELYRREVARATSPSGAAPGRSSSRL